MELRKFLSEHSRDLFIFSLISLLIIGVFFPYQNFSNLFLDEEKKVHVENEHGQVAILDQFHEERPGFTRKTVELFEGENIKVDVYENITIDLYRQLPTLGYKVIILRVHSAQATETEEGTEYEITLFTTESYSSSKYPVLQTEGLVGPVSFRGPDERGKKFAITNKFVRSEMKGKFDNTLLVMVSCSVLNPKSKYGFVRTLMRKGASAIASWNGLVTLSHGNKATFRFLKHIVLDNMTLKKAADETLEEAGPDPKHGTELVVLLRSTDQKLKVKGENLVLE